FMDSVPISHIRNKPLPKGKRAPIERISIHGPAALTIPLSALTLAGFRAWATSDDCPERGRFSFLDKELFVDMSSEEPETHSAVKGEVSFTVMAINKRWKLGRFFLDRVLVTNVEANLSTEPDGTFVLWKTWDTGKITLVPRKDAEEQYMEVQGTPDW